MNKQQLEELRHAAVAIARKAGDTTRAYFAKDIAVERKKDASPVTEADRMAEQHMRELIAESYPDHNIVGEEFGELQQGHAVTWILDPIDGTQSFIHGIPLYTTLIGITIDSEAHIGVIYAPATGEMCHAAVGLGALYNGKPCRVRSCTTLCDATLLSTDITTIQSTGLMDSFSGLLQACRVHRTWGDAYGHMMVASGRADIMFDPVLNIWDAAPLLPILREAGGVFRALDGIETIAGGNGISSNLELLPELNRVLNKKAR